MLMDLTSPAYMPQGPAYLGMVEEYDDDLELNHLEAIISILALVIQMMQRKSK